MGLFDTLRGPVFYKDDSAASRQLSVLQELRQSAVGSAADALDQEIRRVQAGIAGEEQIHFELANSHIPMYVLHDLRLGYDGLTAQIDYLVITRKHQFVLECKNLYGDIEIDAKGNFTRVSSYGRFYKKEGIYSPVTQNQRHLELIRALRGAERKDPLTKALFERHFYENYRSFVVLANPRSVLKDRAAPKEIREQVIKADQLTAVLKRVDAGPNSDARSAKRMEALAQFFRERHQEETVDYTERYRKLLEGSPQAADSGTESDTEERRDAGPDGAERTEGALLCPRCGVPLVRRTASRGPYAGTEFYGCSNYPRCRYIKNIGERSP